MGLLLAMGVETPKKGGLCENCRQRRERVKAVEMTGRSQAGLKTES